MATTLAELELKFKSEIEPASKKDLAALQRVDEQIKKAQASMGQLQKASESAAAARLAADQKVQAAQAKLQEVRGGFGGSVNVAEARRAQEALVAAQKQAQAAEQRQRAADSALAAQAKELSAAQAARVPIAAGAAESIRRAEAAEKAIAAQKQAAAEASAAAKQHAAAQKEVAESQRESEKASLAVVSAWGAVGEAAAKVAIVVMAAVAAFIAFAFSAANAARNLRILGGALTGSNAAGSEFVAIVNQLAGEVPLAKDQIAELAREMSLLKLARRDLQAGLASVAIVTSAIGDAAGGAVKSIIQANAASRRFFLGMRDRFGEFTALAGTGLKSADVVGALAEVMRTSVPQVEQALRTGAVTLADGVKALEVAARARFGKTIAAQMLDFNVQVTKAREAVAAMFDDIDIEPALVGLREFLSVLDQNTVTGRKLKALLTEVFNGIAKASEAVGPVVKKFFQGMLIGALRFYIAIKPVVDAIKRFGDRIDIDWLEVALYAGVAAFGAIALAATVAGVAMLVALLPLALLIGVVVGAIYLFVRVWEVLKFAALDALNTIVSYFRPLFEMDLASAGANIISSLISGVVSSAGALLATMGNLATNAIGAFKDKLLMRSPSKVFLGAGELIAESAAMGVESGSDELGTAVEDMAGGAVTSVSNGASRGGGRSGGQGTTINVYINGQKTDGSSLSEALRGLLIDEFTIADGSIGAGAT